MQSYRKTNTHNIYEGNSDMKNNTHNQWIENQIGKTIHIISGYKTIYEK